MTVRGAPAAGSFEASPDARPRRATAVGRGTHGVADIRRLVDSHFHVAFPHRIWVVGRVGQVATAQDGGLCFALSASSGEEPFSLPCVIAGEALPHVREQLARLHDADVEDVLSGGRLARVGGLLRYDFDRGTLALVVSDVDPSATALGLAEDRRAAVDLVRAEALAEHQRMNICATAPVRVALLGARGDAGLTRAAERLTGSGYGVQLQVATVPLHGGQAPEAVARAVREQAAVNDLVLVVRGDGRPLGLAVFDSEPVVRAVAAAPVPVLTGLSAGEPTACDSVAFAALPTPDAAASWVLARLRAAEQSLRTAAEQVRVGEQAAADRARGELAQLRAAVDEAGDTARTRSLAASRTRQRVVWAVAALLTVALVTAAVTTGRWWLLAALLLVVGALVAERTRADRATTGSRPMDVQDDDFAQVLDRLHRVRDELAQTSSPEKVHRLRDTAAQLLDRGEQILGRHLDQPRHAGPPVAPASTLPPGAAPPGALTVPAPTPAAAANDVPTTPVPTIPVPTTPVPTAPVPVAPGLAATAPPPTGSSVVTVRTGAAVGPASTDPDATQRLPAPKT